MTQNNSTNSNQDFFSSTCLITYNKDEFSRKLIQSFSDVVIRQPHAVQWLNTYGLDFDSEIRRLMTENHLDDFLIRLTLDEEHRNKVIELDDFLFLTFKVLDTEVSLQESEQMIFIVSPRFIWSLQEKPGDYFEHIRERLSANQGVVRKKGADYLLFLIIEAIIDDYDNTYEILSGQSNDLKNLSLVKPSPDFAIRVEKSKQDFFILKKALSSIREALGVLEKTELEGMETLYFSELKEQVYYMIDHIDFELQQLESSVNLIFNLQNHRLNEVMKTLTVFSGIFIPLTFLVGVYGMNFEYMPELKWQYGYFFVWGSMLFIVLSILIFFKKKKWFD